MDRRPIHSRSSRWAQRLAAWLAKSAVTPNQISMASIGTALLSAAGLLWLPAPWRFLVAILGIQLRLVCNLLDGMVAIEGGKQTADGPLYNEMPDRVSDTILLVAAGIAVGLPGLGWCCALLAAFTAYVRVFGGSLNQPQSFQGPMAKQHRMAVLTGCYVLQLLPFQVDWLFIGLVVIAVGSCLTCVTRTRHVRRLAQQAATGAV